MFNSLVVFWMGTRPRTVQVIYIQPRGLTAHLPSIWTSPQSLWLPLPFRFGFCSFAFQLPLCNDCLQFWWEPAWVSHISLSGLQAFVHTVMMGCKTQLIRLAMSYNLCGGSIGKGGSPWNCLASTSHRVRPSPGTMVSLACASEKPSQQWHLAELHLWTPFGGLGRQR